MDYGILAEQYVGFLVAIGGVSMTVLTIVLAAGRIQSGVEDHFSTSTNAESGSLTHQKRPVDNHPTLLFSLILATFCSFVGSQLMAETRSFLAGVLAIDTTQGIAGLGARQFLLASVNIFIGVTVVLFALMLLTLEYKKENRNALGIRRMCGVVFFAAVLCVLWWMGFSVLFRMPAPNRFLSFILPFLGAVISAVGGGGLLLWQKKERYLLPFTFTAIAVFTFSSLVFFSLSLTEKAGGVVSDWTVRFFVFSITSTCAALVFSSVLFWMDKDCPLWPTKEIGEPTAEGSDALGASTPAV